MQQKTVIQRVTKSHCANTSFRTINNSWTANIDSFSHDGNAKTVLASTHARASRLNALGGHRGCEVQGSKGDVMRTCKTLSAFDVLARTAHVATAADVTAEEILVIMQIGLAL